MNHSALNMAGGGGKMSLGQEGDIFLGRTMGHTWQSRPLIFSSPEKVKAEEAKAFYPSGAIVELSENHQWESVMEISASGKYFHRLV